MSETVLYLRTDKKSEEEGADNESMESDPWDDSALMSAYSKASKRAEKRVLAEIGEPKDNEIVEITSKEVNDESQKKQALPSREKWRVGMPCRATYSADGHVYEAVIIKINYEKGTCIVKFVGYKNEEEVDLEILQPSKGKQAQLAQKQEARGNDYNTRNGYPEDIGDCSQNIVGYPQHSGMIPPPPPPFVMAHFPRDEADAMSAMLMSWYMNGYHTGYYQGITRSNLSSQSHNCRCRNGS